MTGRMAYSMGYVGMGRRLPKVLVSLAARGATRLLDVRFRPTSPYPGYRKAAIRDACDHAGLEYIHAKDLGNPFHQDKVGGLARFEEHYHARRNAMDFALDRFVGDHIPILLCGCADHERCHRRVYTRFMDDHGWAVEIVDKEWHG